MNKTVKNFLKEYYEWDESEYEPQQPFIHSSISDLEQLITDYLQQSHAVSGDAAQQSGDGWVKKHVMHFEFWKTENFKQVMSNGWESKVIDEKANYQRRYTIHELYDLFINHLQTPDQ